MVWSVLECVAPAAAGILVVASERVGPGGGPGPGHVDPGKLSENEVGDVLLRHCEVVIAEEE